LTRPRRRHRATLCRRSDGGRHDERRHAGRPLDAGIQPELPARPYRFIHRKYLVISYESDPELIRKALPEPLEPAGNIVNFEVMSMPDGSGFGGYTECGRVIPCSIGGQPCNLTVQMFLDDEPPISGGREIWGFPKKHAAPKLEIIHDTLTGTLHYAHQLIALGTMS
jgi:acetoacetate decarboxylase